MNSVIRLHMCRQKAVVGAQADGNPGLRTGGKVTIQVGVQNEHIGLIKGHIPFYWRLTMMVAEPFVQACHGKLDEVLKGRRCAVVEPSIYSQPSRMSEMLQCHDGLHPSLTAGSHSICISIDRGWIKIGGRSRSVRERRLHAGPLDTEAKCVEPHASRQIKVRAIPVPEIHRTTRAIDTAGLLAGPPVIVRLARPVVSALALVSRGGDSY